MKKYSIEPHGDISNKKNAGIKLKSLEAEKVKSLISDYKKRT